jgi:hypothetical protein
MPPSEMSRWEIPDCMKQNYSVCLATLDLYPVDERDAFPQKHGYPGAAELIVHNGSLSWHYRKSGYSQGRHSRVDLSAKLLRFERILCC